MRVSEKDPWAVGTASQSLVPLTRESSGPHSVPRPQLFFSHSYSGRVDEV